MDTGLLLSAMLIGTLGMGAFVLGKKSQNPLWLGLGLVLMVYPYFVHSAVFMWLIAGACLGGALVLRRIGASMI